MYDPRLHQTYLIESGIDDAETLAFFRDLKLVMDATHQGMAIIGP